MGLLESRPSSSEPISDPESLSLDKRLEDLWARFRNKQLSFDHIPEQDFIRCFSSYPAIAKDIFSYLSLGNPDIEKRFLVSRLEHILFENPNSRSHAFHVAPWDELINAIGLAPQAVFRVAVHSDDPSWTVEINTLRELVTRFPRIEAYFNESVEIFVLRNHDWSIPLSRTSMNLLDNSCQRLIAMTLPSLDMSGSNMIYSLSQHGASFRALSASLKYYPGEILLVVRDEEGRLFGFYSNRAAWTETADRFDESARGTVLFQLHPQVRIRRVNTRGGSNCVYFNVSNPNHYIGLGLGGQESSFRFGIDGSDVCAIKSMSYDATYEPGQVLSVDEQMDIVETRAVQMEIYGCGGEEALAEQRSRRANEEDIRLSRKKVDKMRLVQSEFDRGMFFSNTFKQSGQQTDRLGPMSDRKRDRESSTCPSKDGDPKTIRSEDARKSVAEYGTDEQRRAAATMTVSPDAIRFTPPQVIRKVQTPK